MTSFSPGKSRPRADSHVELPLQVATAPEFSADLARYRKLAKALAIQRKSGRGGEPQVRPELSSLSCSTGSAPSPVRRSTHSRTVLASLAAGASVLAAGLVLSSPAGWLRIDDPEVSVPAPPARTDPASDAQPRPQLASTDLATAAQAAFPLEAALIESSVQGAALVDLQHRLRQAEALSDSYAALVIQEKAQRRILEEELAARQVEAVEPELAMLPLPLEVAPLSQPLASTMEAPQPVATSLPPAQIFQTPLLLSPALLDRLMQRALQLREQGDIAAVRLILESGADSGHGPALFQLAETYDPATLSAWRTFGTKGDVAKARELYLRAEGAGIVEATERLKNLPH